jgi:CRISPR-associated protein Csd1
MAAFDDLEIAKSPHEWRTVSLRNLLRSTALQELDNNVRPNLAGATMKSIITGAPYPQTLLSSVITRIRAEQSRKDRNGRLLPNVTFTRAALLKAFLVRETRLRNFNDNKKEVGMSLDTSITSPGYLLGRLFAVLERAQESANPGINTTIRERFFSVASSTPNAVFPQLIKLKNHHLAKLQNRGQVISMEKQIGEIMGKLEGTTGFPVYLDLREQGRFAIGYYHQRQDFFTRKDNQQQTIQGGK